MTQEKRAILNEIIKTIGEDLELALEALEADCVDSARANIEVALYGLGTLDKQINFYN